MVETFWIDTEMGSDEAVTLIMALRADNFNVVGISALAGNVTQEQAVWESSLKATSHAE